MIQEIAYYGLLCDQADGIERKELSVFTRIDPSTHTFFLPNTKVVRSILIQSVLM